MKLRVSLKRSRSVWQSQPRSFDHYPDGPCGHLRLLFSIDRPPLLAVRQRRELPACLRKTLRAYGQHKDNEHRAEKKSKRECSVLNEAGRPVHSGVDGLTVNPSQKKFV